MTPVLRSKRVDKLIEMVRDAQQTMRTTHDRMDEDLDLLTLKPFQWEDEDSEWETYTSNDPQVYFRKFVAWIASSNIIVEAPYENAKQQARDKGRTAEKFFKGCLNIAEDAMTLERVEPPLLDQMATYGAMRGFVTGLGLLRLIHLNLSLIHISEPTRPY